MKNIVEVATFVHHLASHKTGIASEFKWHPHDTRDASELEIRRRAMFLLSHVTDLGIRNGQRFQDLEAWALAHGGTP